MKERLEQIKAEAIRQINESEALDKLNDVRVSFLGKKGELTTVLKGMKDVAPEDRPKVGQLVNEARAEIERVLDEARTNMERKLREARMKAEVIDVTLPAQKNSVGHRHPNTIALEEVERIFIGMGYEVVEGPEVEKDYYNFEALNIPADHPAKDEQDTFYINRDILLRTQTSGVQVHEMEKGRLPIRMIAPGRVFRADEVDATHSPSFHQIEGLVIDRNITFAYKLHFYAYNSLIASLKYCSLPFTISEDAVPEPLQYCLYSSFVSYVSMKFFTQSFHFCIPFLSLTMR